MIVTWRHGGGPKIPIAIEMKNVKQFLLMYTRSGCVSIIISSIFEIRLNESLNLEPLVKFYLRSW